MIRGKTMTNQNKPQSLNLEGVFSFDVDKFIEKFKQFETYFKTKVKLINSIIFEKKKNDFKFSLDIPSTDIDLVIGEDKDYSFNPAKRCYYLSLDFYPIKILYLKITKTQFKKILKICENIYRDYLKRKTDFQKARIEVLQNLLELIKQNEKRKLLNSK